MPQMFGTDGVRGLANVDLMSPETVMALGRAAVQVLQPPELVGKKPCLLVGRDPRLSSTMLEAALMAGICSAGGNALPVGVIPSGGLAYLVRSYQATAGAMISASHNPYMDNGVKFFAATGAKIPDAVERAFEAYLAAPPVAQPPTGVAVGQVLAEERAVERYVDFLASCFVPSSVQPFRIGLDCANGAASYVATQLFKRLGMTVQAWHTTPDGMNINQHCGAVHPEFLQEQVRAQGLDVGFAFDGDADRLIAIDDAGNILDGDYILAICAQHARAGEAGNNHAVVGTIMSNIGLGRALQKMGVAFHQAQVGDKQVFQAMCQHGAFLGGEPSGHIIFLHHHSTGDGLLTALQLLNVMGTTGASLAELARVLKKYPQVLRNVPIRQRCDPYSSSAVQSAIESVQQRLGDEGRVVVRLSGTELMVRIMVEGPEETMIVPLAEHIAQSIRRVFGTP